LFTTIDFGGENVFCLFGDRTKERLKREEKRVEERKEDKG
jgi:hypothetical protein